MALGGLVLPVDFIGPSGVGGFGSQPVESLQQGDFVKLEVESDRPSPDRKTVEMLPPEIDMSEDQERKLKNYLDSELSSAESERWEQISKFIRLRRKYKTKFPEFPKDWPIANASQITIPIIKLACDTLTSRVYQTVMAADPLASVRTKVPELKDFAVSYEEFLDSYNKEKLDLEDILDTVVTETIKLGTSVVELTTLRDRKCLVTYDPLSKKYKKTIKQVFNGPKAYHFPIDDFWCRAGYQNVQTMPWCGKEIRLTWSQIKDLAYSGELNPEYLPEMWNQVIPGPNRSEQAKAELQRVEPNDWQVFRLYELCLRWDMDGDGIDEEIMVYYHRESRCILRKKFNTFKNGRRPWIVFRYKRMEHEFWGEGMGEMLEQLQDEISTIHNQRIDNATIANLQVILVARLIKGLSPGDRLWTGKIVKVQDVAKDVGTLRLGEVYPNTAANENLARGYVQELSAIGEVATGQAQPVSRTTATAQLALLEELNRRFDKVVKGFRKSIRDIHVHESDLFEQYGTNGLAEEWLGERGADIEQKLSDGNTFTSGGVRIVVLATKSTVNREVEFQSAIAVMNLVTQFGQQILALATQYAPQAAPIVAHELIQAIKGPFRKVIQYSDSGNVEEAVSVLAVLERVLPAPEDMGGMGAAQNAENAAIAGGRGNGVVPQPGQQGNGSESADASIIERMAARLQNAGQNNGRRAGVGQ